MKQLTRSGIALGMALALTMVNLGGQEPAPLSTATEGAKPGTSPDSRTEWALEVRTGGGLIGTGAGGFTLTSSGGLKCSLPRTCARQVQRDELQTLVGLVKSMDLLPWTRVRVGNRSFQMPTPESVCLDCFVTTMVLRLRDGNGTEWTYAASWDSTTQSVIPADFKTIFQAASALTN